MTIIRCPECGNPVSTLARFCPKCGCPTPGSAVGVRASKQSTGARAYAIVATLFSAIALMITALLFADADTFRGKLSASLLVLILVVLVLDGFFAWSKNISSADPILKIGAKLLIAGLIIFLIGRVYG